MKSGVDGVDATHVCCKCGGTYDTSRSPYEFATDIADYIITAAPEGNCSCYGVSSAAECSQLLPHAIVNRGISCADADLVLHNLSCSKLSDRDAIEKMARACCSDGRSACDDADRALGGNSSVHSGNISAGNSHVMANTSASTGNLSIGTDCAAWGSQRWAHCSLNYTFKELVDRFKHGQAPVWNTGGLGRRMHQGRFEMWLCLKEHQCVAASSPGDWFCFVLDEELAVSKGGPRSEALNAPEQWVPWGLNSDLNLF